MAGIIYKQTNYAQGVAGAQGPIGLTGSQGDPGKDFRILGQVTTYTDLSSFQANTIDIGGFVYVIDEGVLYEYTSSGFLPQGNGIPWLGLQGPPGPQGPQGTPGQAGPPANINARGTWDPNITDYQYGDVVVFTNSAGETHSYFYGSQTPDSQLSPDDTGTPWNIFVMQGPQGPQGDPGEITVWKYDQELSLVINAVNTIDPADITNKTSSITTPAKGDLLYDSKGTVAYFTSATTATTATKSGNNLDFGQRELIVFDFDINGTHYGSLANVKYDPDYQFFITGVNTTDPSKYIFVGAAYGMINSHVGYVDVGYNLTVGTEHYYICNLIAIPTGATPAFPIAIEIDSMTWQGFIDAAEQIWNVKCLSFTASTQAAGTITNVTNV